MIIFKKKSRVSRCQKRREENKSTKWNILVKKLKIGLEIGLVSINAFLVLLGKKLLQRRSVLLLVFIIIFFEKFGLGLE